MHLWARDLINLQYVQLEYGWSRHTVADWCNFIRDACAVKIQDICIGATYLYSTYHLILIPYPLSLVPYPLALIP
jgi:hypothetical protein